MADIDAWGYLASGLVLATFCMQAMVPLRIMAICSNLAFIIYGYRAGLTPVLLLHLALLPTNLVRLLQTVYLPPERHGGGDRAATGWPSSRR
jgi:CRP/FNR family transcriptional regulator, cyclic AMP receptor protein